MSPQVSLTLLWFICTLMPCLWAEQTQYCSMHDYYRRPRGQCGNNLDEVLSTVCAKRGFNFKEPSRKRSDILPLDTANDITAESISLEYVPEDNSPFLVKAKAMALLSKRDSVVIGGVTYRRGVTCECCVNQCSYGELEQYCLSVKKRSGPLAQLQGSMQTALYRFITKPPAI